MTNLTLLPQPRQLTALPGQHTLPNHGLIAIPDADRLFTATRLQHALARLGLTWEIAVSSAALPADQIGLTFRKADVQGVPVASDKHTYQLEITPDALTITSATAEGHWNGLMTFLQILAQAAVQPGSIALPCLHIVDWPDFGRRGVMLDISRDKVPTMDTLYALVDLLASWKINELQLYTEHTFAYRQHRVVWQNASPMTGEQILLLDRYCKERFVDLVPNQNSFGHMHRWLIYPEYAHLAEVPNGLDWPLFLSPRPFSITPSDESLALIGGLYAELLPHFSSPYFNVGCDETLDLGMGRSAQIVEERGLGPVYLDFLKRVAAEVHRHGKTMMFWGDIVMEHPELVPELPKDIIAMEWGYEADHPFDTDGERFAAAGVPFYVCPGTSSWLSLLGRFPNAKANLLNAAENGLKHGAIGYLNTDWGDYGHWQPLPVSYAGFAYGAAVSWAVDANRDLDLPTALDRFAFFDPSGIMGGLALELGSAYQVADDLLHINSAGMVRALFVSLEKIRGGYWVPRRQATEPVTYTPEKVRAAMETIDRLETRLPLAAPTDPRVVAEYHTSIGLWRHGCKRLLKAADDSVYSAQELAVELRALIAAFSANWMGRNRPGGLGDSLTRLARLLVEYER